MNRALPALPVHKHIVTFGLDSNIPLSMTMQVRVAIPDSCNIQRLWLTLVVCGIQQNA